MLFDGSLLNGMLNVINQFMPTVKTILYCEDDAVVRHVYKKRLEQAGHHVLYAAPSSPGAT